eukprot:6479570-Amphidinium_carterae.2
MFKLLCMCSEPVHIFESSRGHCLALVQKCNCSCVPVPTWPRCIACLETEAVGELRSKYGSTLGNASTMMALLETPDYAWAAENALKKDTGRNSETTTSVDIFITYKYGAG